MWLIEKGKSSPKGGDFLCPQIKQLLKTLLKMTQIVLAVSYCHTYNTAKTYRS